MLLKILDFLKISLKQFETRLKKLWFCNANLNSFRVTGTLSFISDSLKLVFSNKRIAGELFNIGRIHKENI